MQVWTCVLGNAASMPLLEAFEAVDNGDQDVLNPTIAQIVQHLGPELCAQ